MGLHEAGEHTISDLAELFGVAPYRVPNDRTQGRCLVRAQDQAAAGTGPHGGYEY